MAGDLLEDLVAIGRDVRDRVLSGRDARGGSDLSRPIRAGVADVQYALDELAEEGLVDLVARHLGGARSFRILSEGLSRRGTLVGEASSAGLLLVDPVDGTRGLMHDKRSAFFVAGWAPPGAPPLLSALTHAVMVEIPTTRSRLSDVLAAERGVGFEGCTENLETGIRVPLVPAPDQDPEPAHGFLTVCRFVGGAKARLAGIEDDLLRRLYPDRPDLREAVFEDQYICNAGQLHALVTGRDRMVADLRPLVPGPEGRPPLSARPYDLAASLVAQEAGVVLTGPAGGPFDAPLDLTSAVAFVGYASRALQARVEPHLLAALRAAGVLRP